jgi:hypothetical protein
MKPDPFSDAIHFLMQPTWPTGVYWLLLLVSIGIAVHIYFKIESQRTIEHLGNWAFRVVIGSMWWQQTLWKLPPFYTEDPSSAFGESGLPYWMIQMGKSAAFQFHADFVNLIVLPNFYFFAPIVYAAEALTAASLILGLGVRLWGLIGALQILNLWLGLYNAPGEWPWTYFFLLVLQLIFALHRYGRSLGIDTIIAARYAATPPKGMLGRLVDAAI